jgi:MFS family permease
MTTVASAGRRPAAAADSARAWVRLAVALTLGTIGSVGMWSFVVALPAVQADFGAGRGEASLPFTLTMIGFGAGGILMGRLADRFGVILPIAVGAVALSGGYVLSGFAGNLWQFALAQGLVGVGSSATFGPLMADISHWFVRRRGIAVAIASCGNYLSGTIWPPIIQHFIAS